jgi:glycosyltransferase involved in cell wall biosynthesis
MNSNAAPTVSVIIPAHDEANCIGELVSRIRSVHPDFEIIVIDDGSTDQTVAKALEAGATVYSHPYNIGNGAAIKSGMRVATGDILVMMDGDGQHDPAVIDTMLALFPDYDMVVGARSFSGQASMGRAFANKTYNWLASYVAKFAIKDLTSGFRAVKASVARSFIYLIPNTYSYPTTLTLGVLRSGWSVKYVPIDVKARHSGRSGIRIYRDGVRFLMIIIKICTLFSPLRIFLPVSFFLFLIGALHYLHSYWVSGRFPNMSALMFMTSVIIFMIGLVSEQICQMRYERRYAERLTSRPL